MADSRKYDAGSKSFVNASIATTSVCGSRFRGSAPVCVFVDVDVELLPQAASRPPADPIATAPEATPAAPRRNCRRLYRPSELAIILPPSHVPPPGLLIMPQNNSSTATGVSRYIRVHLWRWSSGHPSGILAGNLGCRR